MIPVDLDLVADSTLPPLARLCGVTLAVAGPLSVRELARTLGASMRNVQRWTSELRDAGWAELVDSETWGFCRKRAGPRQEPPAENGVGGRGFFSSSLSDFPKTESLADQNGSENQEGSAREGSEADQIHLKDKTSGAPTLDDLLGKEPDGYGLRAPSAPPPPSFSLVSPGVKQAPRHVKPKAPIANPEAIGEVFDHWRDTFHKVKCVLDRKRQKRIAARLAEGFTVEDLKQAISGVLNSPFHMGDNQQGTEYTGIETVLRDSAQVEKFQALFLSGPRRGVDRRPQNQRPIQPNSGWRAPVGKL